LDNLCEAEISGLQDRRTVAKSGFEAFVSRYKKRAYFIALGLVGNRDDALELSQEAFFRAYLHIDKFRGGGDFFPWFYQILRNLCFSHLRKRKGKQPGSLDQLAGQEITSGRLDCFDTEAIAQRNEIRDSVWKAISRLDYKHREIIVLRHFHEFSYEQIAQTLFCSKGTVMSRLYYARKKLKEILDDEKGGR